MIYDAKQRKLEKEAEYAKKNLIQKPLKFNLKTESDLIEWVESLKTPYQTYVKRLIRDDMNKKKQETAYELLPVKRTEKKYKIFPASS